MLYFPKGRQFIGQEFPIATGQSVVAEGCALVAVSAAQAYGVQPSSASASELFVGCSVSQQLSLLFQTICEDIVEPSTQTIVLKRTPSAAGTVGVYDVTSNAAIATGGGGWTLSGQTLSFAAGTVGHELIITYRYAITAVEARALQGDIFPGGAAGNLVGQVGVIRNGIVYTTEFDSAKNWFASNPVVLSGAGGLFTIGGTASATFCSVVSTPSVLYPYLGLLMTA